MSDKEKIRQEVERLHEEYRGQKGDADVRKALRTVLFFIDSLPEEPVSNDLEEAAKNHKSAIHIVSPQWIGEVEKAFKAGAEWQKEQMIIKACEWIKEKWDDNYTMPIIIDSVIKDFKDYIKGE